MEMIFTPEIIGCIGNLVSAGASAYDIVVQKRTNERLALLEKELHRHINAANTVQALSDEEYNLLVRIVKNSIYNGTKRKIKRFAQIAKDVMYSDYLDVARGEKFVYAIDRLSDQEVAFLIAIYKNSESMCNEDGGKISIVVPNSKGDYQEYIKKAFMGIGISKSEWLVVLKKIEGLGIIQYEDAYIVGGLEYSLSEFGQKFVHYLLGIEITY